MGAVGNSGLRCRTYSTPVFAPLSSSASSWAALVTGTSRPLEDLVADLVVCDVGAMVGGVVGEVREVDDVVSGGEGVDAEEEALGKVSTPPC